MLLARLVKYYASVLDATLESSRFKWNARNLNLADHVLDTREGLMSGNIFASLAAYQSSVKRARRDIVRARVSCDARPRNRSNDPISFLVAHTDSTNDSTTYGSMSNAFTRPSASAHCICVRACARRRTRKSRLSLFSRMGAKINLPWNDCNPSNGRDGAKNTNLKIRIFPRAMSLSHAHAYNGRRLRLIMIMFGLTVDLKLAGNFITSTKTFQNIE